MQKIEIQAGTEDCPIMLDGRQATMTAYLHDRNAATADRIASIVNLVRNKGAISEYFDALTMDCENCNSCKPIRTNCLQFSPSTSQRRVLNKNLDLTFTIEDVSIDSDKFIMYQEYMKEKHPTSEMNDMCFDKLRIEASGCNIMPVLTNPSGKIVAYTIAKMSEDAIISEYTIYNPELSEKRTLGTLMDLKLLEYGRENDIPYFYTGAVNFDAKELKHKAAYSGSEIFSRATQSWIEIPRNRENLDYIP